MGRVQERQCPRTRPIFVQPNIQEQPDGHPPQGSLLVKEGLVADGWFSVPEVLN